MRLINLEQDTPEWLDFRREGIGGSDAPCIMGVGFKSINALYDEKIHGTTQPVNEAMKRGKRLEPVARQKFMEMTGTKIQPIVAIHDQRDWQFSSLDGYDFENHAWVEIKCSSKKTHNWTAKNGVSEMYQAQCNHHFAVTGTRKGYYVSYYEGDLLVIEMERNEEKIKELLDKELEFYQRLCDKNPPELKVADYPVIDCQEWNDLAEEYMRLLNSIESGKDQLEKVKKRLIKVAGERNVRSTRLILEKYTRKGNIDYKQIPTVQAMTDKELETYRGKSCTSWRIKEV